MARIHERNYGNDSLVSRLVTVLGKKFNNTTNVQICNHMESRYTTQIPVQCTIFNRIKKFEFTENCCYQADVPVK